MRFAIKDGMPYLALGDKAYPVDIKDGEVTVHDEVAGIDFDIAPFTLTEVIAKCGAEVSYAPPKRRRTKKDDAE